MILIVSSAVLSSSRIVTVLGVASTLSLMMRLILAWRASSRSTVPSSVPSNSRAREPAALSDGSVVGVPGVPSVGGSIGAGAEVAGLVPGAGIAGAGAGVSPMGGGAGFCARVGGGRIGAGDNAGG